MTCVAGGLTVPSPALPEDCRTTLPICKQINTSKHRCI